MKLFRTTLMAILAMMMVTYSGHAISQTLSQQLTAGSTLESIKKRGVIRVGIGTFIPWSFRDRKGEFTGFEIEVARRLAKDSGWEVEHLPTAWDGIIPSLLAGKFDTIIGGMTPTVKRSLQVNFTIPYAIAGGGMAANKKLTQGMTTVEDFNQPHVTIAARRGSTLQAVKDMFPKAKLRLFDDDAQGFQDVINGNTHAISSSQPKPALWTAGNPGVLHQPFSDDTFSKSPAGFAIRKGDPDFLAFLNNWISWHTIDGWLKERHTYWFKTADWFVELDPKNNPFLLKN